MRARFGDFLGAIEPVGPRWAYPLSLMQAERYTARRLALVGEAAHVIHPIAGQGLNIGIRDVAALAEAIVDARRLGLDIGDDTRARTLPALAAARRAAAGGGDRRAQPAVLEHDPAGQAGPRSRPRRSVNRLPPLKRLLMQHAMGTLGDRPRLARGESALALTDFGCLRAIRVPLPFKSVGIVVSDTLEN